MTVPVIDALARQYPDTRITVVSRPFVGAIFAYLPANVQFVGINPRDYSGVMGLYRLYGELRERCHPTHVCDLHDVLRTQLLRKFFTLSGLPVTHIHKDRSARKRFLQPGEKTQQQTSFERYAVALAQLGFPVQMDTQARFSLEGIGQRTLPLRVEAGAVGIAPFAAHQGKVYPSEQMEEVVRQLSTHGVPVYLFGAGTQEKTLTEAWASRYPGVHSMVGQLGGMADELRLMQDLSVMLTMDSGNMHLASLAGVRVVSLWGATHPLGGFLGWGQQLHDCLSLDMPCRPCSTFGNKPCRLGDYPCMRNLPPERIVSKLLSVLSESL